MATSYPADLWGQLSPTTVRNVVILAYNFFEKFHLKSSEAALLTVFSCSFRPEVVHDVIYSANVGQAGTDVPAKNLGDSSSSGSRDIRPRSRGVRHFRPFWNFANCQPEVVSDVISGVVIDPTGLKVPVILCDSRSNRSCDMRLPHFVRSTTTTTMTTTMQTPRTLRQSGKTPYGNTNPLPPKSNWGVIT